MRNKTEYFALAVLAVVIAMSAWWLKGVQRQAETPPPAAAPTRAKPPTQGEFPKSHAPLSRTSFRVEKTNSYGDGKRRIYSFFIRGTSSGADYETSLSFDGSTHRSNGHMSEAEYRTFIDGLEARGVWKLVNAGDTRAVEHSSIYMQAGDWSNNVTLGKGYDTDKLAEAFMLQLVQTLPDKQGTYLEAVSVTTQQTEFTLPDKTNYQRIQYESR